MASADVAASTINRHHNMSFLHIALVIVNSPHDHAIAFYAGANMSGGIGPVCPFLVYHAHVIAIYFFSIGARSIYIRIDSRVVDRFVILEHSNGIVEVNIAVIV